MSDLISRQAAIDALDKIFPADPMRNDYTQGIACGAALAKTYVEQLPSAQPEPCEDAVSRQAVYNVLDKMPIRGFKKDGETIHGLISLSQVNSAIINLPSAQPEMNLDEWCTDCKEYDHERHCCPRWNRVIRQTLKDAQPEQWIPCSERLPEEYGEYRITWKTSCASNRRFIGDCVYEETLEWDIEHDRWKGQWLLADYIKEYPDVEVIAWKPLEEPYEERRTDGKDT